MTARDKQFPYDVDFQEPSLEVPGMWYLEYNHNRLTKNTEHLMFRRHYYNHMFEREELVKTPRKTIELSEMKDVFPNDYLMSDYKYGAPRDDYRYYSYAQKDFEILQEKEAAMSMIFVDGDRVVFAMDNTYKFLQWNELLTEMINEEDGICGRKGLNKAFVVYTDSSASLPLWTFFDEIVAGFIVDKDNKEVTAYEARQAVTIYHYLYHLCSAQYGCFYGQTHRTSEEHIHDDSALRTGSNEYVNEFKRRLEEYQHDFDEKKMTDVLFMD